MSMRAWCAASLAVLVMAGVLPLAWAETMGQAQPDDGHEREEHPRRSLPYARPALTFEANRGQSDPEVRFLARGAGYGLFLTPGEFVLRTTGSPASNANGTTPGRDSVLRGRFLGANPNPALTGLRPAETTSSYFRGSDPEGWVRGVPAYASVRYDEVYPGVDVVFHGERGSLEYDFVVAPGARPDVIRLGFEGGRRMRIDGGGGLVTDAPSGAIRQPPPRIYQEIGGRRRPVVGGYELSGREVRFRIGEYDRRARLVIDPVLPFSTHLGGSAEDGATSVAVDAKGSTYVVGWTFSTNFPRSGELPGGPRGANGTANIVCEANARGGACGDAFVTKLDPTGSKIVYSAYLAGGEGEQAMAVAVDADGSAHVTGLTSSADFPTHNALQPSLVTVRGQRGGRIVETRLPGAFVTKLDPTGSSLAYSTYLGGPTTTVGQAIAVDASGSAYVAGKASTGFPTKGGLGGTGGGEDAFVAKLRADGSALEYSTLLGGSIADEARGIAVDRAGNAYVAGLTRSVDFPTEAPLQGKLRGNQDAFVVKLAPAGSSLTYSTFLGGGADDEANGVAVDAAGAAYVAGATKSGDFPTKNALQASRKGKADAGNAFLSRLDATGKSLAYSTYLGGEGAAHGVAVGRSGAAFVTGRMGDGLTPKEPFQQQRGGAEDAFVARVDTGRAGGRSLGYASYLGGRGADSGNAVAVAPSGAAHVAGATASSENFPTATASQPTFGGGARDAFVAVVAASDPAAPVVERVAPATAAVRGGVEVAITGRGFDDVVAVRFGDVVAPGHRVQDSKRITVPVPAVERPGPVVVSVTTRKGTSAPGPGSTFTYAIGAWSTLPATARFYHTATLLADGRVLVAGGCQRADDDGVCVKPLATAELFDPSTARWTATGRMREARADHTATLLPDGKVLVVGARSAERYDPATGRWTEAGTPGRATAPKPSVRRISLLHTATLLPSGPAAACATNCGKVFVTGGASTISELYDPATNSWSPTATDRISGHWNHTATALPNGKVLVAGGHTLGAEFPAEELYNPVTERWEPTGAMGIERAYHTTTLLPTGQVLAVGGRDSTSAPTASAEIYDPEGTDPERLGVKGVWRAARSLDVARYGHSAAALPEGGILVAGGSERYGTRLREAELYDPPSGRWTAAAPMATGRGGAVPADGGNAERVRGGTSFTTTALEDGRVLVVGGSQARAQGKERTTGAIPSAALYDVRGAASPPPSTPGGDGDGGGIGVAVLLAGGVAAAVVAGAVWTRRRRRPSTPTS